MAQVTIILSDEILDGNSKLDIHSQFYDPGRSYEQIRAKPTMSEACGFAMLAVLQAINIENTGSVKDNDGTERTGSIDDLFGVGSVS